MYRLLIVDDEPSIVEGLYDLFEQERQLDLDIYKAYSAKKAIEWLNRAKIDIVLTDIQMPGMSGLELLKEIHSKWPHCKVIFLTAHDEFSYIYQAMQYNVVSYVLKTEGESAILAAVLKCIDEINKSINLSELIAKAEERMRLTLPLLQKEYLINLLSGAKYTTEARMVQFRELSIPLDACYPVILLTGRIDHYPLTDKSLKWSHDLSSIEIVCQQYLTNLTRGINITWDCGKFIRLIQPNPQQFNKYHDIDILWKDIALFIRGMIENIQETIKNTLDISVSFVLDSKPTAWDDISDRFYLLKHVLNYQVDSQAEMAFIDIQFFERAEKQPAGSPIDMTKAYLFGKKLDLLQTFLESGQREEFFKLLTQVIHVILTERGDDGYSRLEAYHTLVSMFLSHINRWNLRKNIESQINIMNLLRNCECTSQDEKFMCFFELGRIIFDVQKSEQKHRMDSLITQIHQYIHSHLHDDLSLVTLSEIVHLNPAYLSRIYKQTTGINLSEYIRHARIDKAKELLCQNKFKIHEIAAQVGYESPAYFARVFKQSTQLTPQEYRDSLLETSSEKTTEVE